MEFRPAVRTRLSTSSSSDDEDDSRPEIGKSRSGNYLNFVEKCMTNLKLLVKYLFFIFIVKIKNINPYGNNKCMKP